MSAQAKTYIAGIGMITPVGANVEMTDASIRAGISHYQETEFFDRNYEPVRMALVPKDALVQLENKPLLEIASAREARLLQLVSIGMLELIPLLPVGEQIPIFMAGPEQLNEAPLQLGASFLKNMSILLETDFDIQNSRCINIGRAGGINAIDTALRYLESSQKEYALVGGVDSFHDLDVINHYIDAGRILTAEGMEGFVPGEAAGFLLLKSENSTGAVATQTMAGIFGIGISQEPGHLLSDKPYRGDGLAAAFAKSLNSAEPNEVVRVYSSMNGEAYWAKELGVARIRNQNFISDECATYHPADCFGDIGAASTVVMSGLAALKIRVKKDKGSSLIYGSSDTEYRGVVRIK